ncbi:ferritin family protein [Endozoicomonas sp. 4G]|uniref:ferritin family protein n=1 Tax=Endozoicomonas sp. 4G TaxID=2872754 RepID=UPI00207900BD|nr:ferritin family protein [Endozoicomonas sp. 4G]
MSMNIVFNIDQILQMSERIEENNVRFYEQAAEKVETAENKAFLEKMASFEKEHESCFSSMRKELSTEEKEQTTFDPEDQSMQYCQSHADLQKLLNYDVDFSDYEEVLKAAIQHEKDAILFYVGMKDFVPARLGLDKIEDIIHEEMSHINILSRELKKLKEL